MKMLIKSLLTQTSS